MQDARTYPAPSNMLLSVDVLGGIVCIYFASLIMRIIGQRLFQGVGWGAAIGWESVWVMTVLVCIPLFPLGIQPLVNTVTTLRGLALDWPELAFASIVMLEVLRMGMPAEWLGPLGFALSVGIAEELIFRVLLLGWLVTKVDVSKALLISSIVFGMAHLHELSLLGIASVIPQFAGGMVLGAVYLRTRNIIGPILAHAYWDLPYFLAFGNGVSGGGTEAGFAPLTQMLIWAAFTIYAIWLIRVRQPEPLMSRPQLRV